MPEKSQGVFAFGGRLKELKPQAKGMQNEEKGDSTEGRNEKKGLLTSAQESKAPQSKKEKATQKGNTGKRNFGLTEE